MGRMIGIACRARPRQTSAHLAAYSDRFRLSPAGIASATEQCPMEQRPERERASHRGPAGALIAAIVFAACVHSTAAPPAPQPTSSLALRLVDSSRAAQPLLAVRLRLIGPIPQQDTVVCADSTRQSTLWVPSVRAGRYQLVLRRTGYERRLVLVDVGQDQKDTVTVALHPLMPAADGAMATMPPDPPCTSRRNGA